MYNHVVGAGLIFYCISLTLGNHGDKDRHWTDAGVGKETTFYQVANIRQYNNYGSIELFEHSVPEMTTEVEWRFETGKSNSECPTRNVTILMQSGSYPLPEPENNKTYPSDFYLERTALHTVVLETLTNVTMETIQLPVAGRWFGAAYIDHQEDNSVIKAINDLDCHYNILVNVTAYYLMNMRQLVEDAVTEVVLSDPSVPRLFRFYIEENIWGYDVVIPMCVSSSDECPLKLSTRGGALPDYPETMGHPKATSPTDLTDVSNTTCQSNVTEEKPCVLQVVSPLVNRWHYLIVQSTMPGNITAQLQLHFHNCLIPIEVIQWAEEGQMTADDVTEKSTSDPTINKQAVNIPHTTPSIILTDHLSSQNKPNYSNTDAIHEQPTENNTINKTSTNNGHKEKPMSHSNLYATNQSTVTHSTDESIEECGPINSLHRIENINNPVYAVYSLGPGSQDEVLTVSPTAVALVQFDVLPIKDTGGTLSFKAAVLEMVISPNHTQNITVRICLCPSRIPAKWSQYYCPPGVSAEILIDSGNEKMDVTHQVPYPEPGAYYIGLQTYCYILDSTQKKSYEPCVQNYTLIAIEITNGPCVNSSCDGHGSCTLYRRGAYTFSSCNCDAAYRGYTCEDDSDVAASGIQMLYTMLLTLSNLFFIPATILAVYRRYYVEAIVYFSNMFFSGFYHACDMSTWSIYRLCIMPYHTLSFCDFLLSIYSFWVTLLAMAELPPVVVSSLHMTGAIALAMAVDWVQHTLYPYIAPITVGVVLVITMWIVRSVRRKKCYPEKVSWFYMIPGFILAIVGLVLFAFVQDDINYPYVHSAWHACMALCILFLLPRRKQQSCLANSKDSDRSSDDIEFNHRYLGDDPYLSNTDQYLGNSDLFSDNDLILAGSRENLLINSRRNQPTETPRFILDDPDLI